MAVVTPGTLRGSDLVLDQIFSRAAIAWCPKRLGRPLSNLMSRPRRILVNSWVRPGREVNVMTRRLRGWLYAGSFFVVSGVLVAMPSVAHAGIALNGLD